MVSSGMVSMQNQAAYAQGITPVGYGVPMAPLQPMQPAQPSPSPFVGGLMTAAQIMGGYGAVKNAMPGSAAYNQAVDQMQMQAVGMVAGPSSPWPLNQVFQGMQQQYGVNRMLEQNFQFMRPGLGRGFTPVQQLQVGAGMRGIASETPFLGMPELTQLMQQGAQMGQYSGIRDVQGVMRRTRELIKDWQTVATELNLTLQEAARVSNQLKQMGVFRSGQQAAAIQGLATTAAISGQSVQGLIQAGAMGAQAGHQLFGQGIGVRRQAGAVMTTTMGMIGTAQQAGIISQEQLFEATGMTGEQGQAALGQRIAMESARFLKKGRGKVTMAAFVNPDTMQIDDAAVNRFMSGNMSISEIERRANQNKSKMGYVKWNANKARLGAEFSQETGGMGELALMRSWLGEGVMEDTDRSRLILSRKTGFSQAEIEAIMPMMRELPMIQNRIRNETRMVEKQRAAAERWNQYGPQAQFERQKGKIRDAIVGPIDDLRGEMQRAFVEALDGAIQEGYEQNQQTVSEATRDLFARAARGDTQAEQQVRAGGTFAGSRRMELFKSGTALLARHTELSRPGTFTLAGLRERGPGGTYREAMGQLARGGAALTGKLGGFGGNRFQDLVEKMGGLRGPMELVKDEQLYNAYTTGKFDDTTITEKLGFASRAQFNSLVNDQEVAVIMGGGGTLQDKMDAIKKLPGVENNEQARAIMAKVSNDKGYLDKLGFMSPSGKSSGMNQTIKQQQQAYIDLVTKAAGLSGQENIKTSAGAWLADAELQQMAKEGKEAGEITKRATDKYGAAAGKFVGAALTVKGGTTLFGLAGEAQWALEGAELTKRRFESQREDIKARMDKGGFLESLQATTERGARKGATREEAAAGRAAKVMKSYAQTVGKYDLSNPEEAQKYRDEMDRINSDILSMPAGDLNQFVKLARQNNLTDVANDIEAAAGRKKDLMRNEKKARAAAARTLLGDKAGEYEWLIGDEGLTRKGLEELKGAKGLDEGQREELAKLATMTHEELAAYVAEKGMKLADYEQIAISDKQAEDEHNRILEKQSWQAMANMDQNIQVLTRTLTQTGVKINLIGGTETEDVPDPANPVKKKGS